MDQGSGSVDRHLLASRFASQTARFASSTHDRPDMWTATHASKPARAKHLPAWLSAKRTAAFGSALRARARRRSAPVLKTGMDNFTANRGDSCREWKSPSRLYLAFSPRSGGRV